MLVRIILIVAGALAVLLVGRNAGNYEVVQGMIGIALLAGLVAVTAAAAQVRKRRKERAPDPLDAELLRRR